MRILDLTHTIAESMPVYPGTELPALKQANSYEKGGFKETLLCLYSHTGRTPDGAPSHSGQIHFSAKEKDRKSFARFFSVDASAVSGQTAVRTDNPVTGNDDAQWIMPDRPADGLR
mgnify:CR=1 FL=1